MVLNLRLTYQRGHSVNQRTDPPLASHNPAICSVPQAQKTLTSPPSQIKSPDSPMSVANV